MRTTSLDILEKAELPPMQSHAILKVMELELTSVHESLATKADLTELRMATKADLTELRTATKADFTELRTEMKTDIAELRAEFKTDIAELRTEMKTDIAELRTEVKSDMSDLRVQMTAIEGRTTRWVFTCILAQTAVLAGLGSQAPLIGHHQLTVGLLRADLLSPNARIVIAGAEPARGGVPLFSYTDVPAFAAKQYHGDRTAAVEALLRNGPNVKYVPNNAYADAKLIVAWWAAALARRLPPGMAVYAVSPGAATDTKVVRNAGLALKYLFIPIVNLIPGMNQTPETAARRYLQASEFGTDVSGQFFASAQGKLTGPIEAQRHPHLHDRASQEAAWQAVVKVSGVDLS